MGEEAGALALVIGGASGIGAAVADAYRAQGTPTVTWDIADAYDVTCVDRPLFLLYAPDMTKEPAYGEHDHVFRLADSRRLRYLDLGDPDGLPVVSCHGGLSSRLDVVPAADTATELGVRIISPDRPGVGGSDRKPGRTLLDWPADVAALTEQLGIERFAIMGWSLGGSYAMACAQALSDRVSALGVIAGGVPPTWPDMIDELNRLDRVLLRLSESHPHLERSIFHVLHATAEHAPRVIAKQSGLTGPTADAVTTAIAQGLTDVDGVQDEYKVFGAPWGFEPAEISVASQFWQGTADDLVPEAWGHRLAAAVPGATLHIVEGGTHFLWYEHWTEILGGLVAAGRTESP
jgi:pimeloyl-ACP methyl ester carboxylesterase